MAAHPSSFPRAIVTAIGPRLLRSYVLLRPLYLGLTILQIIMLKNLGASRRVAVRSGICVFALLVLAVNYI